MMPSGPSEMIKDSDKKLFDIVLVWKLDRFARNRYDSARYKTQLKKNGVKQLLVTVLNHLLKLRAVVRLGRDSTVTVVLDDGDAVLFRIGSAFTNLAFNGFFALVIR